MSTRTGGILLLLILLVPATGCGSADTSGAPYGATPSAQPTPTAKGSAAATRTPTGTTPTTTPTAFPCDPGGGFPRPRAGCPDPTPDTGWVSVSGGGLVLQPFRTYGNDAEGRAYAAAHGLEFPFPNDYFDARTGDARPLPLSPGTVCTGIILLGHHEPLEDHVVDCGELRRARGDRVPAAVWTRGERVVQVSELYRP